MTLSIIYLRILFLIENIALAYNFFCQNRILPIKFTTINIKHTEAQITINFYIVLFL